MCVPKGNVDCTVIYPVADWGRIISTAKMDVTRIHIIIFLLCKECYSSDEYPYKPVAHKSSVPFHPGSQPLGHDPVVVSQVSSFKQLPHGTQLSP